MCFNAIEKRSRKYVEKYSWISSGAVILKLNIFIYRSTPAYRPAILSQTRIQFIFTKNIFKSYQSAYYKIQIKIETTFNSKHSLDNCTKTLYIDPKNRRIFSRYIHAQLTQYIFLKSLYIYAMFRVFVLEKPRRFPGGRENASP